MPLEPTLAEVIRGAIAGKLLDVHTALPGRVKTYDADKQVADVIPMVRGVIFTEDDEAVLEELPVIPNVPVSWPRGGGYSLQFPLAPGDHGLLVFNEACIAQWRVSGEMSEPGDLRRHDLSYPVFFPGIAPDSGALPSCGSAAVLDGPTIIRLGGTGADFVALSTKVDSALSNIATFLAAVQATLTGEIATPVGPATVTVPLVAIAPTPAPTGASKVKAE